MDQLARMAAEARERGIRPWIAVKEKLAELAIRVLAEAGGEVVLQGGAALHFAYGSPRLSADVDFAGSDVARALAERGERVARAASELLARPARWSLRRSGRLLRGKVTIDVDTTRRLVLPVEAYEVPAHTARDCAGLGRVEEPEEIAADKIVASADRLARRGTLKLTDLYDLWFVCTKLGAAAPSPSLVAAKAADYGQPRQGAGLAAAVRAIALEEVGAVLEGVLPAAELRRLDTAAVIRISAQLVASYGDVL